MMTLMTIILVVVVVIVVIRSYIILSRKKREEEARRKMMLEYIKIQKIKRENKKDMPINTKTNIEVKLEGETEEFHPPEIDWLTGEVIESNKV